MSAEDDVYEMGIRDGYAKAIQELDIATGGNGEYCYVIGFDGEGRHCPDERAMKQRIIERFEARLAALQFSAPGLLVLRNMCARAGLKLGEAKAAEIIAEVRSVLCAEPPSPSRASYGEVGHG